MLIHIAVVHNYSICCMDFFFSVLLLMDIWGFFHLVFFFPLLAQRYCSLSLYMACNTYCRVSPEYIPRNEIAGSAKNSLLLSNVKLFPKRLYPFTDSPAVHDNLFSYIMANNGYFHTFTIWVTYIFLALCSSTFCLISPKRSARTLSQCFFPPTHQSFVTSPGLLGIKWCIQGPQDSLNKGESLLMGPTYSIHFEV